MAPGSKPPARLVLAMSKYLTLFWAVPASAVLLPLALILMMATLPRGRYSLSYFARDIYEVLFWITPAVGVAVLLSLLAVRVFQPGVLKRIDLTRTARFACLDVLGPVGFLLMQMILSGFTS